MVPHLRVAPGLGCSHLLAKSHQAEAESPVGCQTAFVGLRRQGRRRRLYHHRGANTLPGREPPARGSVLDLGFCSALREGQTRHLPVGNQGSKGGCASAWAHRETCRCEAGQLERGARRMAESRVPGWHAHFTVYLQFLVIILLYTVCPHSSDFNS